MADWHQACCRKHPLRASRAPTNRPTPMAISRTRTKSAARGAAVSKNASLNRLSPGALLTAFHSCLSKNLAWYSAEFILPIGREVLRPHSRVSYEHLPGVQGDNTQSHKRDWNTVFRPNSSAPQYEFDEESLPPITGHAANSRKNSRPFNNAFESFLFSRITLCVFPWAPFSPGSRTHT